MRGQVAGRWFSCAMMNVPPGYPRGAQGELDAPCQCATAKANNTHTQRRAQKTILGGGPGESECSPRRVSV